MAPDKEPSLAIEKLGHSVRMARETGGEDVFCEALLALARLRAGERFEARAEAERLSKADRGNLAVSELWCELGERDRAVEHALRAHKFYVSDGDPYVLRYYLIAPARCWLNLACRRPTYRNTIQPRPKYTLGKRTCASLSTS